LKILGNSSPCGYHQEVPARKGLMLTHKFVSFYRDRKLKLSKIKVIHPTNGLGLVQIEFE